MTVLQRQKVSTCGFLEPEALCMSVPQPQALYMFLLQATGFLRVPFASHRLPTCRFLKPEAPYMFVPEATGSLHVSLAIQRLLTCPFSKPQAPYMSVLQDTSSLHVGF